MPATIATLPASITSVARLIPSTKDSLQPYRLSNLDLVTESLTLMAGILRAPDLAILYRLCTPVVVSSESPLMPWRYLGYFSWMRLVRSPPSSRIMLRGWPLGKTSVCSMHHTYSSSVSPFHAYTGTPTAAIAAAAWSCVEKMLQEDQVTSAPSSRRVSMRTAVCTVMWRQPAILAPLRGLEGPYFCLRYIRPGISFSARVSSLRPQSAREMSATLYGTFGAMSTLCVGSVVAGK